MFIKRHGRRCLILQSYRDGRGKVCHRRLGHFVDAASLERALKEIPAPEQVKIRQQAQGQLAATPPPATAAQRAEKIRKATRALLNCLAEESDETVLESVAEDLELLGARLNPEETDRLLVERSRLAPRRRKFDPGEAGEYARALDERADDLPQEERLSVRKERVERCPTPESRLAYGVALHQLGRYQEALAQYEQVPRANPHRHLHAAAACWRQGQAEEAMHHLCRGVARDPELFFYVTRTQKRERQPRGAYWAEYGDMWTDAGVQFAMAVCSEPLVRRYLREAREDGVQPRQLVKGYPLTWLVPKALALAALPADADVKAWERNWRLSRQTTSGRDRAAEGLHDLQDQGSGGKGVPGVSAGGLAGGAKSPSTSWIG